MGLSGSREPKVVNNILIFSIGHKKKVRGVIMRKTKIIINEKLTVNQVFETYTLDQYCRIQCFKSPWNKRF